MQAIAHNYDHPRTRKRPRTGRHTMTAEERHAFEGYDSYTDSGIFDIVPDDITAYAVKKVTRLYLL